MDEKQVLLYINNAIHNNKFALGELEGDGEDIEPWVQEIIMDLDDASIALERARHTMREVMNG